MAGSGDEATEVGDMETLSVHQSGPYLYDANDHTPCILAPPEAFSDEPAPRKWLDLLWPDHDPERTGPDSAAVESRLFSSCAGWREPPTAPELYDAIREPEPTRRQRNIVNMWAAETTPRELFKAWAEHAYTWRQLVAALHRSEFPFPGRIRLLNRAADVPEYDGVPTWKS